MITFGHPHSLRSSLELTDFDNSCVKNDADAKEEENDMRIKDSDMREAGKKYDEYNNVSVNREGMKECIKKMVIRDENMEYLCSVGRKGRVLSEMNESTLEATTRDGAIECLHSIQKESGVKKAARDGIME